MLSLKRAGEEDRRRHLPIPPALPNTKGLPHLQGGETIAGFEDPSSRVIIPPLGQRPAVDRLPSGAVQLEVCKSVAPSRQRELCRGARLWILANRINRSDSHVSQHQDSPKWVNLSHSGRSTNVGSRAPKRTKTFRLRSVHEATLRAGCQEAFLERCGPNRWTRRFASGLIA